MAETEEGMGIFLKVFNNGKERLDEQMTDLTPEKNDDLETYTKKYLSWCVVDPPLRGENDLLGC